jgi:hypothetical protein
MGWNLLEGQCLCPPFPFGFGLTGMNGPSGS